mmetsp:Transcript_30956/g.62846  ORF Transcript_30956/g.62846 Transcript_30956/m.62846 type:complete len:218 (-) Transcript_30956:2725-3378(-)
MEQILLERAPLKVRWQHEVSTYHVVGVTASDTNDDAGTRQASLTFATFTLNLQYAILPPVSQIFLVVLPILLFERRASGRRHQRLRVSAPELNLRHHELEELYNVLPSVPGNKLYPAIIALEAIVRTRVSKWMMANSPSSRISSPLLLVIRHEAAFAETSPLLVEEDKDSVKDCCKRMRDIVESFDVVSEGVAVVSVPVTGVDELAGGLPGLSLGLS